MATIIYCNPSSYFTSAKFTQKPLVRDFTKCFLEVQAYHVYHKMFVLVMGLTKPLVLEVMAKLKIYLGPDYKNCKAIPLLCCLKFKTISTHIYKEMF